MLFDEKMHPQKMGFREYIEALEEERKKIQVFPRELPLSLELITQAIEACKLQLSGTTTEYNLNGQSECSMETSTEEGLVFEEFIPIKKTASPGCDEEEDDDDDEQHSSYKKNKNATDKKKSDWLRSVQLWNPEPPPAKEDVPRKTNVVEVKRNGGAFQPFHREESAVGKANNASGKAAPTSPSQQPVPATSSTGPVRDNVGSSKREEKGQTQRKQRRCWSQELHKRFLHALQQLGGADSATPKQIRELMKVDGLTNDEVKSHLQKFRLHTRRSPVIHNNANSQTAPLFLVGNIFVQPPEYAAVASTTATASTVTAPTGIYAPVAAHPPAVPHTPAMRPQFKQLEVSEHSHSEERVNHSEGAVHSNSPASSSSTHTPTTSPGCC